MAVTTQIDRASDPRPAAAVAPSIQAPPASGPAPPLDTPPRTSRGLLDRFVRRFQRSRRVRRFFRPRWWFLLSRNTHPVSPLVGLDRGLPIDRHFIEAFLGKNRADIRGRVLEVKDREYTVRFGGQPGAPGSRVEKSDVLDINRHNAEANVYDDIRYLASIPDETYDCLIVTQTLQYVDDLESAIISMKRVLKPGGVLFVSMPTVGKLDGHEDRVAGHYWRLTVDSARFLFSRYFSTHHIEGWGNVRLGMAFLAGLAVEDMSRNELEDYDPVYTCGVLIRAVKEPVRALP